MHGLLASLKEARKKGVKLTCSDGQVQHVFLILAAYVANHPEQCLFACFGKRCCPKCVVEIERLGWPVDCAMKNQHEVLELLICAKNEDRAAINKMELQGLCPSN